MWPFARKPVPVPVSPPWPSALNPCKRHKAHRKACYGVKGKVTELCTDCVWEQREIAKVRGDEDYLSSFMPDPDGADCKKE